MSKSKHTQEHYRAAWKGQTSLDAFQFMKQATTMHVRPKSPGPTPDDSAADLDAVTDSEPESQATEFESFPVVPHRRTRTLSTLSDSSLTPVHDQSIPVISEPMGNEEMEEWEEELDVAIKGSTKIRDWKTLHEQIKKDLKNHKHLPLSHINQLMILQNFATLRLKGASRMCASAEIAQQWHEGHGSGSWFARRVRSLARHYQIFERLPKENRGGSANSRSFLNDESVQAHCRMWLSNRPTGQVTPRALKDGLQSSIFPELGIVPNKPISERTARRWLIKLGW